ncbi:MAG: hypothetical protein JXA64_11125 [Candidatus Fermentibacteraceae bacterium]|nr:hypothetical protein [Candidatus Fermentibacteraceae bacterium]
MAGSEMHWKDLWEKYSAEETARMEAMPAGRLLQDIRAGHFGDYYGIWRVVGSKASLEEAGWTLFEVLETDIDYLYRYHCAAALLKLMGMDDLQPVDLSGNHSAVQDNIRMVRCALERRIGPPGTSSDQP